VTHGKIDAAAEDGFTEEVTEEVNGGGFSTAARAKRAGDIAPEDQDFAKRCLARYRAKYRAGSISDRTARQLGLIDAQGKEQS
jgi:hypothetical protein